MAGSFAKLVGARELVLNHIGSRFPAPQNSNWKRMREARLAVMKEVERQAGETWGMGKAQAAVDFMRVAVHAVREAPDPDRELEEEAIQAETVRWVAADVGEGASANGHGSRGGYSGRGGGGGGRAGHRGRRSWKTSPTGRIQQQLGQE